MDAAHASPAAAEPRPLPVGARPGSVAPLARLLAALAAVPPVAGAVAYVAAGPALWPLAAVLVLLCALPPALMARGGPSDAFSWRGDAALLAMAMLVGGGALFWFGGLILWISGLLLILACATPSRGHLLVVHVLVAALAVTLLTSPLVFG
ncbi:MAG TPA: hypothetical protein VN238_09010 [Solirubrobacteraceae bacterium]|nr:hypothetical protein [Solirubrobacteraceae bacterium]